MWEREDTDRKRGGRKKRVGGGWREERERETKTLNYEQTYHEEVIELGNENEMKLKNETNQHVKSQFHVITEPAMFFSCFPGS